MIAFGKGFKPGHVDRGVMDKNVFSFFLLYKSESFFVTEPFYFSVRQNTYLLVQTLFKVMETKSRYFANKPGLLAGGKTGNNVIVRLTQSIRFVKYGSSEPAILFFIGIIC